MNKSSIIGACLAGFAFLVLLIGLFIVFFGGKGDNLPASPTAFYDSLSEMSPEEQERGILSLAGYKKGDSRFDEADEVLRKIVKDSKVSPIGRAAAINALAEKKDLACLPDVADCLYDDNLEVRRAAAGACRLIMGLNLPYEPNDSPEDRKPKADEYRANAKVWYREKVEKVVAPTQFQGKAAKGGG